MNLPLVLHILGALCLLIGTAMVAALGIAFWGESTHAVGHAATQAFAISIAVSVLTGFGLLGCTWRHRHDRIGASEGFAVAACGWMAMAAVGALPFYLCRGIGAAISPAPHLGFIDAYFECMSGFSTTGSSVFGTATADGGLGLIENLPRSLLFWRSLTHWLGGMGIVVLCLAILPALRAGGYQMFQAEVPGPTAERLQPRIRQTAAILWGVYALLTAAQTILLRLGGMTLFDSLCHTFGTVATGGFSTRDASIGAFSGTPRGLYIEIVIMVFMYLAGCNFLLHFRALHGHPGSYLRDAEFRFYSLTLAAAAVLTTADLYLSGSVGTLGAAWRQSTFHVLSITTTTGFTTADFNLWPGVCRAFLLLLMCFGGCAGSTAGGLKQIRILVAVQYVRRELLRLLRPRLLNRIQVGDATIDERLAASIIGLTVFYIAVFTAASLMLILLLNTVPGVTDGDSDRVLVTAFSAVAATINNIGPGLSAVGAGTNYGWMPAPAKLLLSFCMLLGRLELYSVVVILLPHAWRR